MDDFILRIFLVGFGIAIIAGPLGCFVVWRKMAYFGDTVAHASLLGLALSFVWGWESIVGVFVVTLGIASLLLVFQRTAVLSNDTILGILAHGTLACGLLIAYLFVAPQTDLTSVLLGDIVSVSWNDAMWVGGVAVVVLGMLVYTWSDLIYLCIAPEIAAVEGRRPDVTNTLFVIMLAMVISVAIKIVGVLLITALMIIPAATARFFAKSPEAMAVMAASYGVLAVAAGLVLSLEYNTPVGPCVVMVALGVFILNGVFSYILKIKNEHGMKARNTEVIDRSF